MVYRNQPEAMKVVSRKQGPLVGIDGLHQSPIPFHTTRKFKATTSEHGVQSFLEPPGKAQEAASHGFARETGFKQGLTRWSQGNCQDQH